MDKYLGDINLKSLRAMFYAVTPNETIFEDYRDVPDYTDSAVPWMLFLVILEYFFDPDAFAFNDTLTSINAGIFSLIFKFGGRILSAALYPTVWSAIHLVDLPLNSSTWFLSFLCQDLAYYLGHRAIHEAGVFWSFHQMHHSSEYYNLSTAVRQGAIQDLGMGFFDLMQSLIIPPQLFYPHKYLNILYQFWLHTEAVPYLGPLEYILNTPSSHRVHHGRNPYCIDRNYGATLIIWDRIFGTYAKEREEEPVVYGLVTPVNTFDQFKLQFFEFKELGYDKGQMKNEKGEEIFPGFWNKVKSALYPPGYFPGVKTKQFFLWRVVENNEEGIPEIDHTKVKRFNPHIPMPRKCYIAAQFLLFVMYALPYFHARGTMGWPELIAKLLIILTSMQSFGYYLDHKDLVFAQLFDVSRLILFGAVSFYFNDIPYLYASAASLVSLAFQHLLKVNEPSARKARKEQ